MDSLPQGDDACASPRALAADVPKDLFELVTAATSVSETLPRVVARLKESHEDLELNPATFDFYCKQVMTCPFVHENVVDVALWILGVATHPPDPHDDQSNAIILSLLEIFVKEDSASVCSELVSRGFLPTLKDYVTMKHGKWASRPAIRLMFDICRLNRLSRDQLGVFAWKSNEEWSILMSRTLITVYPPCAPPARSLSAFVDKEFLEFLFDLVEQTRYISEELEDYNYSVIRLLVSLLSWV